MNERKIPKESEFQKSHTITSSQDLKGSSSQSNFYVSKIMKQNKIKNESLINESLPNLKKSIQNIFSNEDEKEKIFQFLIKKNKDRSTNVSKDVKNNLKTPDNRSFRNFELKKIKSPSYYDYYPSNANNNNNKDMTKSCYNLGGNNNTKETHTKIIYNYSGISGLYPEDDTLNQNEKNNANNFYHNTNNSTFTNLLANNNIVNVNGNRNKAKNKVEHIAIYNTYNNTFNSFRMQKNKDDKNDNNNNNNNKSLDNKKNYYYFRRSFNNKENNSLEKNPYKDYMKNSNLFGMKKKITENYTKKSVIDISDSDKKKDENSRNKKILYLKRDKNDIIRVQKNDNLAAKKNSISINNSFININNSKKNYYIHKNPRYKKIIPKKVNTTDDSNTNIKEEVNNNENNDNNVDNNKIYEKRRNYFDIYGNKDIRVNTLESIKKSPMNIKNNEKMMNKTIDNDMELKSTKLKIIKVNIDKNINKKFLNSPPSIRFNKYPDNNNNNYYSTNTNPNININTNLISSNSNKKIYEKRDPFQRSPKQRFNKKLYLNNNNTTNDIFNRNKRISNAENNNNNIINNNNIYNNNNNYNMIRNKLVFNNEEEIIEFIKKKYNKRNVDEIFNRNNNNNNNNHQHQHGNKVVNDEESNTDRGRRYGNVMSTEEGNKIKLKNEELSSEITQLKNDNKKYKKELIDMKTKYNDLNKQMNTIKEKDNNNKY